MKLLGFPVVHVDNLPQDEIRFGIYRTAFILCPTCRRVVDRGLEAAESPTNVTRVAERPCAECQAKL